MKAGLSLETEGTAGNETYDAEMQYLHAWADGHVFDLQSDPVDKLSSKTSLEEILRIAIGMEKESIVFYLGFKEAVPAQKDRDQIDKILREEMKHIAVLSTRLKAARSELV